MQSACTRLQLPLRHECISICSVSAAQLLHGKPPLVFELQTCPDVVRDTIDQDDAAFLVASSPSVAALHRLSRLAIDDDATSSGLLIQSLGLVAENTVRLAENA